MPKQKLDKDQIDEQEQDISSEYENEEITLSENEENEDFEPIDEIMESEDKSPELKYEELEIADINLKDIKKIDKLGNGMFIIKLASGEMKEISLDDGEASIIDHFLNRHLKPDGGLQSDAKPSVEIIDLPIKSIEDLERNLGSNMDDVEFVDPNIGGFWAINDDIPRILKYGYTYARPHMIKFFDSTFGDLKPGEGFNPEGPISINGHTLMVARKETQQAVHDLHYNRREKPETHSTVTFK